MKPNPLASLNHFTVPFAIAATSRIGSTNLQNAPSLHARARQPFVMKKAARTAVTSDRPVMSLRMRRRGCVQQNTLLHEFYSRLGGEICQYGRAVAGFRRFSVIFLP